MMQQRTNSSQAKSWGRDTLLIILLLSILFGFMLGSRPLNVPDEARYSEIPLEMIATHDYVTPHLDGIKYFEKPALFYWMQVGAIKLLGDNNWAYRITTAFMALLGCLIIYWASLILYDRRTALISTGILSTSLIYFAFAHIVTLDVTLSVFMSGALLSFICAMRFPPGIIRRSLLWSCYAFAGFAVMTKGLVGAILPGAIIFSWLMIFNEWRQLKCCYLISGTALFLLITLPWHVAVQLKNPEFFYFYFIQQQFTRYLTDYAGRYKPFWFFIPIIIIGLFPWICFLWQSIKFHLPKKWKDRDLQKEPIFLMLWAAIIFVFFSLSKSKLIPYILPTIPPLIMLVGHYLANVTPNDIGITRGFKALPIVTIVMSLALLISYHFIATYNSTLVLTCTLIIITTAITGSFIAKRAYYKYGIDRALINQIVATACCLLVLTILIPSVDMNSISPLTRVLTPLLKPDDEVATFHFYYQDLPVYLHKRILIVGWKNELTFGIAHQNTHQWILDDATFWKLWSSPKTIYMITTQKIYNTQLLGEYAPLHLIAETRHDVLLANH